ncbi:hypothetical protein J3R83DRAFT_738 [Lanmaoa asiatica]|nr:hypothetical protein J3R83DRAFT_738 [Lanmaoa asiatica]
MQVDSSDYRPATPDSPLASSLYHATSTIDDLTLALTNFSRVPSPEPQRQICCCCGAEECDTTTAWLALKSKLESRLVLSAEVGSALLQRHEAYVRRHEVRLTCILHDATSSPSAQPSGSTLRKATEDSAARGTKIDQAEVDARVAELLKENAVLEKVSLSHLFAAVLTGLVQRLTQTLLNNELAEASNKTLLHELEEARRAVSRLSAHHARTVGLDTKLSAVLQENDDIRQESDSQTQRAKLAEMRLAALKDCTDKLQAEVRRLQDDLEIRRLQRLESSESLLQDVRSRLDGLQISHVTKSVAEEDPQVIKVIESLVVDNEMLKADNKELHKLLTESREDLQALQRELGEQSIAPPIRGKIYIFFQWHRVTGRPVETPSKHSRTSSGLSSFAKDSLFSSTRRPSSVESRFCCAYEPLTPETGLRPLSPVDSLLASATKCTNFAHPQPRYPPSHLSLDTDNEPEYDQGLLHPNQATKAIQTDRWLGLHGISQASPSFMDQPSIFPHDGHSDSSSSFDGIGSPMSSLLERMHSLLHRMTQADALTLTNRLKRQHLRGADVKHLSRTTVGNILSDISHLRAQYRAWLEDDKITTLCTRKDLRGLFKLFKEVLEEMGQMRVILNDIILDPTIAVKVSEMALDLVKAEVMEKERKVIGIGIGASWMAPLSKLFNSSSHSASPLPPTTRTLPRPTSRGLENIRASRPVPKIGPALGASATTVNVEFSGTGAGKSVTSVFSAHPNNEGAHGHLPNLHTLPHPSASTQSNARSVMGIFAGAPHPDDTSDPWVVLPRAPRRVQSAILTVEPTETGSATIGRSAIRKRKPSRLSRDVDAILDAPSVSTRSIEDSEADDIPGPLLERTLRRRGLSDSSIHSTFMSQGGGGNESAARSAEPTGPWLERTSVLRTLSRTVQNFKQVASHTISGVAHATSVPSQASMSDSAPGPSDSYPPVSSDSLNIPHSQPPRISPPILTTLIPSLTSWAAAGAPLDSTHPRSLHGNLREDAGVPRLFGREGQGRDI